MIKNIHIERYRKLKEIDFEFNKGINVISGTNGTCKTSLLHIISNSFQAVNKSCPWINDKNCIDCIRTINNSFNPKIETLTKGDKQYNDPAPNHRGVLYTTQMFDSKEMSFRRHESNKNSRYAVKPYYKKGTNEALPYLPIIYLGLTRLFPYGEYQNDDLIVKLNKSLPEPFQRVVADLYKNFTGIGISNSCQQNMGGVKKRAEFITDHEGVDSNTISAGEDNLFIIITALVSLRYYYESIESSNDVESILLIDEVDATLHPAFQLKLLNLFREYSENYKIQIFFTSHSLSLIEKALDDHLNVIYLLDNITTVYRICDVDIFKIKTHLYQQTGESFCLSHKIPIFMEDDEARLFWEIIKDYLCENDKEGFARVSNHFHLVQASLGAENLKGIFDDSQLLRSTIRSICILDGDKEGNMSNNTICLPGKKSPERLIIEYAAKLFQSDAPFWVDRVVLDCGFSKPWYRDNFLCDVSKLEDLIAERKEAGNSKGVAREQYKGLFHKYKKFFIFLMKHWVKNPCNKIEIDKFHGHVYSLFKKVSILHDINPSDWSILKTLS